MAYMENREDRVAQLKACASEIIDRAEELIGSNEYSTGYTVSIELFPGEAPTIKLERTIIPIKRLDKAECL
jgi:hypothetical protein